MQTIIHTINGTYIVPAEKHAELLMWLNRNAVKSDNAPVKEQHTQPGNFTNRELLSE